jgi:hypothetical protein
MNSARPITLPAGILLSAQMEYFGGFWSPQKATGDAKGDRIRLDWCGHQCRRGFDACVKLYGWLLLIPFKASGHLQSSGGRKILAPRAQMMALKEFVLGWHG